MADDTTLPGTGDVIAADDIGGVKYQRVKIVWGVDGTATETSASNPFPVTVSNASIAVTGGLTDTELRASAVAVSLASVPSHAVTNAGTFATQAAQSGTWTVQPGNTANTTAWLVTGTGGTFPATQSGTWNITNVSGTVSLPTGAATAAKQPALGTAGASSADVISVQGIASGTAMPVSLASVPSHAVTNAGTFAVQANVSSLNGTTTDTNSGVKSAGTLRVVLATDQPALTNKLLVTPDSVALPANQSVNVSQINGVTALMGNGVTGTGSQRVTIASDNTAFSVNAAQSGTYTVGLSAAQTLATVTTVSTVTNLSQLGGVAIAMNTGVRSTGTQRVTIATDDVVPASQSGTWTVQPGNTANTTAWKVDGSAVTQPISAAASVPVGASALTGGIPSTGRLLSAAGTSGDATNVKASAGRLYAIQGYNASTSVRYLKLYNSASAPTAGSGTPVKTLALPPTAAFAFDWAMGLTFATGIGFTLVTGSADNSSTSVTAADIVGLNLDYA